jgi:hypothetical protein
MIDPGAARAKASELDARIAGAFADDAKSVEVSLLLEEVEVATEGTTAVRN